jgi:hypothetical protein
MKKQVEVLCEIIFRVNKSAILTSRIGRINTSQVIEFSTNSKDFIIFKEHDNPPILKTDIEQIIIHREEKNISIKEEDSMIIKNLDPQRIGEIS